MIALLQRVSRASVRIEGQEVAAIGAGLLVLVGVQPDDRPANAERLLERVLNYRVFVDPAGKMNLSLRDTGGGLLLVPQFTLAADTGSGNRPSFTGAAPPALARERFDQMAVRAQSVHTPVACGVFGADMQVALINDGPVTFWLQA